MRDPYQREHIICTFAITFDELQVRKEISNDELQHRDYVDNRNRVKINRNIRAKVRTFVTFEGQTLRTAISRHIFYLYRVNNR